MSKAKPVLPIHNVDVNHFNGEFKGSHLDKDMLGDEDIAAIKVLFGLDDRSSSSPVGRTSCDDYHAHGYQCNYYMSPEAGVVERLLNEIIRYKSRLKSVHDTFKDP